MVIPGTLTAVMPMAQRRSDGPASRFAPCVPSGSQKSLASKTKEKRKTVSLFHAKRNCRIACWNVLTLGPLSPQSLPLTSVLRTMQERNIGVLAVSESRWTGQGVTKIGSYTILHSGSSSTHGVAIILSPKAASSWETGGSVFLPVSECIIRIRMKTHLGFATIVAVYAPVNPINATSDARAPSDAFYDALHSTLSSAPSRDMTIILGDFNARVGSRSSQLSSVVGPYGPNELNENGEQLLCWP